MKGPSNASKSTPQPRRRPRRDTSPTCRVRDRCVIYARESPSNAVDRAEEEGRQTPFDTQIAECLDSALTPAYKVVGEPLREIVSRAELWDREVLDKARQMVRNHEVEVLLVHAMERLAIGNDFAVLLSEATYHGARIEFFIDPGLDPTTPEGAIIAAAKAFSGHMEHQRIRERTQRGRKTRLDRRAAAPRPPGQVRLPLGHPHLRDGRAVAPHPRALRGGPGHRARRPLAVPPGARGRDHAGAGRRVAPGRRSAPRPAWSGGRPARSATSWATASTPAWPRRCAGRP